MKVNLDIPAERPGVQTQFSIQPSQMSSVTILYFSAKHIPPWGESHKDFKLVARILVVDTPDSDVVDVKYVF